VVDSDGFSEKNSGDYLVEINDFCREMIRVIDRMEETRKREQDDYPARWKGLGETLKELRKELKALLAS
jgi:molecular chaperone GrpE (heat shock protein)